MLINGNSSITYVGQEPAPAGGGEGAKDQEVTEPDVEDSGTVGEEGQEDGQDNDPEDGQEADEEYAEGVSEDGKKKPMSKEERAAAAKRRREHERQELARQIRAEEQARSEELINSVIAGMRIRDEESGKLITTKAELDAYNAQRDQQLIDEGLDRAGIDRTVIDAVIENHPAVKAAQSILAKAEVETRRAQDMTAEERGKQQLELITGMDPTITNMEQLSEHESYERVYTRVKEQGLSISDAFYLENRAAIEKRRVEAAVKQAMNLSRGKEHLQREASHGSGGVDIPEATKRSFRNTYPGISDAEIQKKYIQIYGKKG